jgi:hypothetical protein
MMAHPRMNVKEIEMFKIVDETALPADLKKRAFLLLDGRNLTKWVFEAVTSRAMSPGRLRSVSLECDSALIVGSSRRMETRFGAGEAAGLESARVNR